MGRVMSSLIGRCKRIVWLERSMMAGDGKVPPAVSLAVEPSAEEPEE